MEKREGDVSTLPPVGWLVLVVRWGTKKWAYGGDKPGNLKYHETPKERCRVGSGHIGSELSTEGWHTDVGPLGL